MKVSAQQSAARSGGTNKFDELFLTPTMGAADPEARDRIFRDEPARDLFGTDEDAGSNNPANPDNPSNNKSTTVVNADIFDTVSALEGPFAFNFGNYKVMVQDSADEIGPAEGDREPTVQDTGSPYPYGARPQSPAAEFPGLRPFSPQQVRVMSYNINNFFDNKDDPNKDDEFDETTDREPEKQQRAVDVINDVLKRPDVIALQEVENQGVVDRLAAAAGGYRAFHEEGNDNRSIDNAFLIKNSVRVSNVRQLGKGEEEPESIPADQDCSDRRGLLFDRPPLAADIRTRNGQTFTVFANHFAAKGGGSEAEEGGRSRSLFPPPGSPPMPPPPGCESSQSGWDSAWPSLMATVRAVPGGLSGVMTWGSCPIFSSMIVNPKSSRALPVTRTIAPFGMLSRLDRCGPAPSGSAVPRTKPTKIPSEVAGLWSSSAISS